MNRIFITRSLLGDSGVAPRFGGLEKSESERVSDDLDGQGVIRRSAIGGLWGRAFLKKGGGQDRG
jgi:hypothetical protein